MVALLHLQDHAVAIGCGCILSNHIEYLGVKHGFV